MKILAETAAARTIGISGHLRPDGDCVGAAMGLYLYLKKMRPEAAVDVYLEEPAGIFDCIAQIAVIKSDFIAEVARYDVFFALDTVKSRMGAAEHFYDRAVKRINIDHHISNAGDGDINMIDPQAGSTCELIYRCLDDPANLDREIAKALYIGMMHDTGVFQYSCTTPETLRIAAQLIKFDFDFPALITQTFYEKTFRQNRVLPESAFGKLRFYGWEVHCRSSGTVRNGGF